MVKAIKNGQTKEFSDYAWKLLGSRRNGWEKVSDSVAENTVGKKDPPPSGTASKQVVSNTAKKDEEKNPPAVINDANPPAGNEGLSSTEKETFLNAVKDNSITKNQIKDFLDSKEVSYKANDSLDTLSAILFEQLKTVEALKTQFSI